MGGSPIIKPTKDLVEAVKAKTDNLPASPANEATLTAMKQKDTGPAFTSDAASLQALAEKIVQAGATTETGHIRERFDGGTNYLCQLLSPGSANVLSAWEEFWPETDEDVWICSVIARPDGQYTLEGLVEVGVGAGGSEVTKVRFTYGSLLASAVGWIGCYIYTCSLPIKVPITSRIAIRCSDNQASQKGIRVSIQFYAGL